MGTRAICGKGETHPRPLDRREPRPRLDADGRSSWHHKGKWSRSLFLFPFCFCFPFCFVFVFVLLACPFSFLLFFFLFLFLLLFSFSFSETVMENCNNNNNMAAGGLVYSNIGRCKASRVSQHCGGQQIEVGGAAEPPLSRIRLGEGVLTKGAIFPTEIVGEDSCFSLSGFDLALFFIRILFILFALVFQLILLFLFSCRERSSL